MTKETKMKLRRALQSYGIEIPPPEPEIDPRDIEEARRREEDQAKQAFTRRVWKRYKRGE